MATTQKTKSDGRSKRYKKNTMVRHTLKMGSKTLTLIKYTKDSKQKIILLKENIAAKHMSVGLFYLNRKNYLAALKRYQIVIDEHSQSKYTPEALHRLVEIYYSLGMIEEAKKTASVLSYNYPKSKWYIYSYNLVGDQNVDQSKKTNLFKKILNKISSKNEK